MNCSTQKNTFAIARRDLIKGGEFPPSSIEISDKFWEHTAFNCWLIQGYDDNFIEKYDLILVHPMNGQLFWSYRRFFNFFE